MIRPDAWQAQTIEELQTLLMSSTDVLALALFGSALKTNDQFDIWSDLDCLLVVTDDAFSQYYPAIEWLSTLGKLHARQQSDNVFHGTTRVCFTDFRRLDCLDHDPVQIGSVARVAAYSLLARCPAALLALNPSHAPPFSNLAGAKADVFITGRI